MILRCRSSFEGLVECSDLGAVVLIITLNFNQSNCLSIMELDLTVRSNFQIYFQLKYLGLTPL